MSEKETLPPTQPDLPVPEQGAAGGQEQPTLPVGSSGDPSQGGLEETAPQSSAPADDRTVLVGHEEEEEEAEPLLAWLVITSGGPVGKLFALNPDITSIGRDPQNDIVLRDDACSSQHAKVKVEREEEARFYLLDLASTNGTFVNGEQIYRHLLVDGDRVTIGETELVFKKV
jgi:hypothetical protein